MNIMNYAKQYGKWLKTPNGRKFSMALAGVAASCPFSVIFLSNTVFIDNYKEIVSLYKNGVMVNVPKVLHERFDKAVSLAGISEPYRKFFSPFSVCGFDIFSIGSASSRFGCAVGLPINFNYTNVDKIDKYTIKIQGESVVWDSLEGSSFLESLIMSEKAQIYAIAREAKMLDTHKLLLDSLLSSAAVLVTYRMSYLINNKYNFLEKPRSIRFIMYGMVAMFCLGNYLFIKDAMQMFFEKKVDADLKEENPLFAEGAIEFYSKILQRNRALRLLMGAEGESRYTAMGNENYLIRQRHLPLVQRKDFFEDRSSMVEKLGSNVPLENKA